MELSNKEMLRYNRQIVLKGFDLDGQEKLKCSKVLIIGLGGLGCAASPYLASAGIGHLTLLDFDTVNLHNLQRQILHTDTTVGMSKSLSAAIQLKKINPHCQLEVYDKKLNNLELSALIANHDLVLDCTDNMSTREQINCLCFLHKTPMISGASIRMEGQLSIFTWRSEEEPCYRCISRLFGKQILNCMESGIIAPLVGIIGTMQAMEALKVLTSFGKLVSARLLMYDASISEFYSIKLVKDKYCEVCG